MKKVYNQPTTEIALFETEKLLQGLTVSTGSGGSGGMHAPARQGIPE